MHLCRWLRAQLAGVPVTKDGIAYVAQRAEHLGTGEVRIYYAPTTNYNQVAFVVRK